MAFLLYAVATVALTIFLERMANVKKSKILPANWKGILKYIASGNLQAALELLAKDKKPLAKSLYNLLLLYSRGEIDKKTLSDALSHELELVYARITRGVSFLSVAVTLSTLLGLIGTVFGLIDVFATFSVSQAEGLKLLAKGISTSLNSTAAGLLVAIFTYILYWIVKERINSVYTRVAEELEKLLEILR